MVIAKFKFGDWHMIAALVVGLVAISTSPIFIRLSEMEISPYATIFHRSWMAAVIFGVLGMLPRGNAAKGADGLESKPQSEPQPESPKLAHSLLWLLLGFGLTFTIAVVTWAWALTQTTIANSTFLHSFTPIFTGLLGLLFFGLQFRRWFWIGMAIAIAGALLLGFEDVQFKPTQIWGDGVSLVSALFFSTDSLLGERLRQRLDSQTIMFWCYGLGTLLTLPLVLWFPATALPISANGWLTLLAMTLICQVLGHGLLTYALKDISAGIVSLCHLLVPVLSTVEAWLVFNESLSSLSLVTFAIVLGGIAISVQGVPTVSTQTNDSANSVPAGKGIETS